MFYTQNFSTAVINTSILIFLREIPNQLFLNAKHIIQSGLEMINEWLSSSISFQQKSLVSWLFWFY
jgi:hypothetical protein